MFLGLEAFRIMPWELVSVITERSAPVMFFSKMTSLHYKNTQLNYSHMIEIL